MLTAHLTLYLNTRNESISPITSLDSLYIEHVDCSITSDGSILYTISRKSLIDDNMPVALIHNDISDISSGNIQFIDSSIIEHNDITKPIVPDTKTYHIKSIGILANMLNITESDEAIIKNEYDVSILEYNLSDVLRNYETVYQFNKNTADTYNYIDTQLNIANTSLDTSLNLYVTDISTNIDKVQSGILDISTFIHYRFEDIIVSDIKRIYKRDYQAGKINEFIPGKIYRFTVNKQNYEGTVSNIFSRTLYTFAITPHLLSETCYEISTGNVLKLDFNELKTTSSEKVRCYYMKNYTNNIEAPCDHYFCISNAPGIHNVIIKPGCSNIKVACSNVYIGYDNTNISIIRNSGNTPNNIYIGNLNNNISIEGKCNNISLHNLNSNINLWGTFSDTLSNINIYSNNNPTTKVEIYYKNLCIYNNVIKPDTSKFYLTNTTIYSSHIMNYESSSSTYNNSILFDGTIYANEYYAKNYSE